MTQLSRRALLAAAAASIALPARADNAVRLGTLQFGTVQWVADVIRRHDLDTKHGFTLRGTMLANTDAGRVSLMAGASDVILSDWPFAAVQRADGTKLCFAPFSSATGGIMAAADSPIRRLADLKGRKLGVAGGPADKSWLVVQAAARGQGIDLATEAKPVFGAPPLLGAKLQQGELDAVLTYWNFSARLEAAGFRQAVSVADCAKALDIPPRVSMVGFVFREDWGNANRSAIDGFLAAVDEADGLLAGSVEEWTAVRPLMDADSDALFVRLRDRYLAGVPRADAAEQARGAARLLAVLHETGGSQATGGIETLPPGVFWPVKDGSS
nr:ABC transporter substrate-binding protein [uncultured Rhodopila sp.]